MVPAPGGKAGPAATHLHSPAGHSEPPGLKGINSLAERPEPRACTAAWPGGTDAYAAVRLASYAAASAMRFGPVDVYISASNRSFNEIDQGLRPGKGNQ